MRVLLKASFEFPKGNYWMDSMIDWVVKINSMSELIEYIENNQYIKLNKSKPEVMYNWDDFQCGYMFKFYTKDEWKTYRWELWLEMSEVKDLDFSLLK